MKYDSVPRVPVDVRIGESGVIADWSDRGNHWWSPGSGFRDRGALHRRGRAGGTRRLEPRATQAAVETLGGPDVAHAVRCNVTDSGEVDALVAAATDVFGGLDIMVNNAGITRDATMRKMTEDDFDQVISVHLKGT